MHRKSHSSASRGLPRLLPVAYMPGRYSEIPKPQREAVAGWVEHIWLVIVSTTVQIKMYGRCSWREHLGQHPRTETPKVLSYESQREAKSLEVQETHQALPDTGRR